MTMLLAFFSAVGTVPSYVQQFDMNPGHLTDDITFTNPNPWTMTLSWQTVGSNFTKPTDVSVAAFATDTIEASHSGAGGEVHVDTTTNSWTLPNGSTGTFGMQYNFTP